MRASDEGTRGEGGCDRTYLSTRTFFVAAAVVAATSCFRPLMVMRPVHALPQGGAWLCLGRRGTRVLHRTPPNLENAALPWL